MIILCVCSPDKALSSFVAGAEKSLTLSLSLIPVYSVWLGVFELLERAKANDKVAALLSKPVKKLFFSPSGQAVKYIALNLSLNALGLGGAATPPGVKACALLEKENNRNGAELLLVIAATSVQILPVSVLALMNKYGSSNSSAMVLPCLLSSLVSSVSGVVLFFAAQKIRRAVSCRKKSRRLKKVRAA